MKRSKNWIIEDFYANELNNHQVLGTIKKACSVTVSHFFFTFNYLKKNEIYSIRFHRQWRLSSSFHSYTELIVSSRSQIIVIFSIFLCV